MVIRNKQMLKENSDPISCSKVGSILFPSDRTSTNGLKLHQVKFGLDIRKKFLP